MSSENPTVEGGNLRAWYPELVERSFVDLSKSKAYKKARFDFHLNRSDWKCLNIESTPGYHGTLRYWYGRYGVFCDFYNDPMDCWLVDSSTNVVYHGDEFTEIAKAVEHLKKRTGEYYEGMPCGVLLSYDPLNKKKRSCFIANADQDIGPLRNDVEFMPYVEGSNISISFECLRRLVCPVREHKSKSAHQKALEWVARRLADDTLHIEDATPDARVPRTGATSFAEREKCPGPGFTWLVNSGLNPAKLGYWHRPAMALIADRRTENSYLMGRDDNQYFGVQLPYHVASVEDAAQLLKPDAVIQAEEEGRGVVRQGEWFVVQEPLSCFIEQLEETADRFAARRAPSRLNAFTQKAPELILPKQDPNSSDHVVTATHFFLNEDGAQCAYNGVLTHSNDDHPPVRFSCTVVSFHENTALRSVSVEGVD